MHSTNLEVLFPRLRRFSRCLLWNISEADEVVCECLEALVSDSGMTFDDDVFVTEIRLFGEIMQAANRRKLLAGEKAGKKLQIDCSITGTGNPSQFELAMSDLSFDERVVVALHILEGFGLGETANLMGQPMARVCTHLQSARARVRDYVAETAASKREQNVRRPVAQEKKPHGDEIN